MVRYLELLHVPTTTCRSARCVGDGAPQLGVRRPRAAELCRIPPVLTRRRFLAAGAAAVMAPRGRLRAARYDLVIRGGRVLDPSTRLDRVADVAIAGGRIHAIEASIASADAADTLD